ncbi:GNAT family N-acetyltransferase [Micromonospora pallida]|nr:GNAT family N-acetyltransferase [Micromonospora pallida]
MTDDPEPGGTLLETERLRLRRFTLADLDHLVALDSDPEVMRYLTGGRPTPLPVVRDQVLPRLLGEYDRWPGLGRWAATDRTDGTFLGWFALDPPADPSPEPAADPAADSATDPSTDPAPDPPADPAAGRPQTELGRHLTQAELGYRLRRSVWGRGLATEGSRALVHYAFRHLGLRRVWAQTMAVNLRSRRVMEKAGLRYVRTFHLTWDDPIPGSKHGEVEYEILRSEC